MREIFGPPLRAAALSAFIVGLALLLINPPSLSGLNGLVALLAGAVAIDGYADRIVIYQDTLERDFGHDPALLRAQVERTVRHEVAHHLGWDETGVRGLGL
jgi:predicted Zn-dependent protease with MMP-like domain